MFIKVCKIKNNTKEKLTNLIMQLEVFINSKRYVFDKKVISNSKPLDAYSVLEQYLIELPSNFEFEEMNQNYDILIKYFGKKQDSAPWTLIKIDSVDF